MPWQSRQAGASGLPFAASCPWVLLRYVSTTSAWQTEQSTRRVIVEQGRACEGCASLWHCAQAIFAWREPCRTAVVHEHASARPAP